MASGRTDRTDRGAEEQQVLVCKRWHSHEPAHAPVSRGCQRTLAPPVHGSTVQTACRRPRCRQSHRPIPLECHGGARRASTSCDMKVLSITSEAANSPVFRPHVKSKEPPQHLAAEDRLGRFAHGNGFLVRIDECAERLDSVRLECRVKSAEHRPHGREDQVTLALRVEEALVVRVACTGRGTDHGRARRGAGFRRRLEEPRSKVQRFDSRRVYALMLR
eukprot:7383617-Prymnesium_polylepis.2